MCTLYGGSLSRRVTVSSFAYLIYPVVLGCVPNRERFIIMCNSQVIHRGTIHPSRYLIISSHHPGVGGSIPVVFTLGAELFPTPIRGAMVSLIAR